MEDKNLNSVNVNQEAVEKLKQDLSKIREETGILGRAKPLSEFLSQEIPPTRMILSPWLPSPGLVMFYGLRGHGKSWVLQSLALSLAMGTKFMRWKPDRPWRVLYLDGELPESLLMKRFKLLLGSKWKTKANKHHANLRVICTASFKFPGGYLNLADKEHREMLREEIEHRVEAQSDEEEDDEEVEESFIPEVIFLDNVSSLFLGIEESSNSDWSEINRWLIQLRDMVLGEKSRGVSIILAHHAGKKGVNVGPRGASAIEGALDTSISIEAKEAHGLDATLKFQKERHLNAEPRKFDFKLEAMELDDPSDDYQLEITTRDYTNSDVEALCGALERGAMGREELEKELGWPKNRFYDARKVALGEGRIRQEKRGGPLELELISASEEF